MNLQECLKEMKSVQVDLISYLDEEIHPDEKLQNLITNFNTIKIYSDQHKLKLVLHLIAKVADNHHRKPDFFNKIERILHQFKDNIIQFFTDSDIFNIFKSNKRILLFLIEDSILIITVNIVRSLLTKRYIKAKYHQYFSPEIKPIIQDDKIFNDIRVKNFDYLENRTEKWVDEIFDDLPDDFYSKRKIGENDNYICQLIRNDSVVEFIAYVNKKNISLKSKIEPSIYETNLFLIKNNIKKLKKNICMSFKLYYGHKDEPKISLIEYAAFYGSIQIFNYLKMNKVKLPPTLMNYAIHSDNPELINIIEEINKENYEIYKYDLYHKAIFNESIKCHHFDISNYIKDNYFEDIKKNINQSISTILRNYNFIFIFDDLEIDSSVFFYFCKYDYYICVENQLKTSDNFINDKILHKKSDKYSIKKTKTITPLCISIERENNEIVKLLLKNKKIDINIQSQFKVKYNKFYQNSKNRISDGCVFKTVSPLQLTIENENSELIKLILSFDNLDINNYNEYSESKYEYVYDVDRALISSLFYAVEKENIEIVKLLLENKNINHKQINIYEYKNHDSDTRIYRVERTSLHIAIEKENIDIINLLLKSGFYDINFPMVYFNYQDYHEEWDISVEKFEKTPLHIIVEKRNIKITELLLSNENVDANALLKIFKSNIFINNGKVYCNTIADNTTFDSCYKWKNFSEIKYCKEQFDYNETLTAFHIAIKKSDIEMVKLLLANEKVDANILFSYEFDNNKKNEIKIKKSALYLAIETGDVDLVKVLLDNEKINVNLSNYFLSHKKLHRESYICYNYDNQNVYEDYKDVFEDDTEVELSSLHYAVKKGNKNIIISLLNNKNINTNSKDSRGRKPIELTNDFSIKELFH